MFAVLFVLGGIVFMVVLCWWLVCCGFVYYMFAYSLLQLFVVCYAVLGLCVFVWVVGLRVWGLSVITEWRWFVVLCCGFRVCLFVWDVFVFVCGCFAFVDLCLIF